MSPKVGLLFRTTEWLTTWGSYAEAFLAPGLTEQSTEGLHFRGIRGVFPDNFFVPNPDSKPETTGRPAHAFRRSLDRGRPVAPGSRLFRYRRRGLHRSRGGHLRGDDPPNNPQKADLRGFETELGYDASRFFAAMSYSETRGKDAGRALTSVPPDKLVATLGLRVPELSRVFTGRGRFVNRRDQVPAGVPVTPGYGVCDLYASWLPAGASYSGLRVDFGIENADKSYRRPLSLIDEGGEISSSRFPTGFNGEVIPDVRIVRVSFGIDQRS